MPERNGLQYFVTSSWLIVSKNKLKNAAYAHTFLVVNYVCENEESSMSHKCTCVSGDVITKIF